MWTPDFAMRSLMALAVSCCFSSCVNTTDRYWVPTSGPCRSRVVRSWVFQNTSNSSYETFNDHSLPGLIQHIQHAPAAPVFGVSDISQAYPTGFIFLPSEESLQNRYLHVQRNPICTKWIITLVMQYLKDASVIFADYTIQRILNF